MHSTIIIRRVVRASARVLRFEVLDLRVAIKKERPWAWHCRPLWMNHGMHIDFRPSDRSTRLFNVALRASFEITHTHTHTHTHTLLTQQVVWVQYNPQMERLP